MSTIEMPINLHRLIEPVHQLMVLYRMPMSPREYEEALEKIIDQGHLIYAFQGQFLTKDEIVTKLIVDLERLVMIREKMSGRPPLDGWTTVFADGANSELYDRIGRALLQTLSEAVSGAS